jgi:putative GTP pyrophosphokinase
MNQLIEKDKFLEIYRIDPKDYEKTKLKWTELEKIFSDYISNLDKFNIIADSINKYLLTCKNVHSVRSRVKDPEHLVEKIIRKEINNQERNINIDNYLEEITDLIGVRALHLFKSDWIEIHDHIAKKWDFVEDPIEYKREGDDCSYSEALKSKGIVEKVHDNGYRSLHYIIKEKYLRNKEVKIELQVRTIFEEGWSEIDHRLRYPYYVGNAYLENSLLILNRLAGSADEMAEFIQALIEIMRKQEEKIIKLQEDCQKYKEKSERSNEPIYPTAAEAMSSINTIQDNFILNSKELASRFMISPYISDFLFKEKKCKSCGKTFQSSVIGSSLYEDYCEECRKRIFGL